MADRRLAISRPFLDSIRDADGEWDHEYSAVIDSTLPFNDLVAQVGPEPFGSGSSCFADLQMRVYVGQSGPAAAKLRVATGLRTAQQFFPSATLASRDSAQWHIDRLYWNAWYADYGGQANVEIYTTIVRGRRLVLVFMYATLSQGLADDDRRFILEHLRLQ